MELAKISVIIPVYNSEKFLAKCLESVLKQTYQNIEIICVDDGSSDKSLSIVMELQKKDSRIICFQKKNEGVSYARNFALKNITGDYVLFVDSDDWIEPKTCEVALQTLKQKQVDVVMWSYIRESKKGSKKKHIFDSDVLFDSEQVYDLLYRRMVGVSGHDLSKPENADALCTVWGKLYRRDLIEEHHIHFYDIRKTGTYEDGLFNLEYFSYVKSAFFMNEYLYHYRRDNQESVTAVYNKNLWKQYQYLYSILKTHIVEKQLDSTFTVALNNRIALNLVQLGINIMAEDAGATKKIRKIQNILTDSTYHAAVKQLCTKEMPMHWKVFFMLAKRKSAIGVYSMLAIIQVIRGR